MADPLREQEGYFRRLSSWLRGTAIDKALGLSKMASYREFAHEAQPAGYSFFKPLVDRALGGEADVLFPGRPAHVLCSSGTTGDMKYVPCSARHVAAIVDFQRDIAMAMVAKIPGFSCFVPRINVGNYGRFDERGGARTSYISGLFNQVTPGFLKNITWPDVETLKIADWDERVGRILDHTLSENIQMLSGTAPTVLNFIRTACARKGVEKITDIWPRVRYIIYTGLEILQIKEAIDRYFDQAPTYYGPYMATEGMIGLQEGPFRTDVPPYLLAWDRNLFSFRERGAEGGGLLAADELDPGHDYEIFISNYTGLIQYALGDILRLEEAYPRLRFRILGRDKVALNAAGERLSDAQVMDAFVQFKKAAAGHLGIDCFFAFPEPSLGGVLRYVFALVVSGGQIQGGDEELLDREIRRVSIIYDDLRATGALSNVSLEIAPASIAAHYAESAVKGNAKLRSTFPSRGEFMAFFLSTKLGGR
jgi:hypothetical protein